MLYRQVNILMLSDALHHQIASQIQIHRPHHIWYEVQSFSCQHLVSQLNQDVDLKSNKPIENFNGYAYSVRFHTAVEYDGGLSGCTISESKSWGKYAPHSKHQSVWVDSTIGFPLVITALLQRLNILNN